MFPRPSRILRWMIFLVFLFLFLTSVYMFTSYASYQNTKMAMLPISDTSHRMNHVTTLRTHVVAMSQMTRHELSTSLTVKNNNSNHILRLHLQGENKLMSLAIQHSSQNVPNPHSFPYIHNPLHICRDNLTFIIYIHSSPLNFKKRQAVRQTWGHPSFLSLYNARLVFILGSGYDQSIQGIVDMEALTYGDIVQEEFIDSYRNLTYKGIAALKWAGTYCTNSEFVLKADDDILIDIVSVIDDLFLNILPKRKSRADLILCNLWTRMKVIRDPKSKWFISKEEFSGDYFPAYCSGSAFLLSSELVPQLYKTSLHTPFFWVDDFYITGLLVKKLNIQHTRYNDAYLLNSNLAEERVMSNSSQLKVFHVKKLRLFIKLWPFILKRHKILDKTFEIPEAQWLNKLSLPPARGSPNQTFKHDVYTHRLI